MARRKSRRAELEQRIRYGKVKRIRIPQPVDRPIRLHARNLIKTDEIKPDAQWHIVHRRGIRQPKVGEDPLEARAVKKTTVLGTLPERIVYKYLLFPLRFKVGIDFTFQSSLQGGRIELGGIVADFLFERIRLILRVQGPTHKEHLRFRKDEEQRLALEGWGYRVLDLDDDTIYNEYQFLDWMRKYLVQTTSIGTSWGGFGFAGEEESPDTSGFRANILNIGQQLGISVP